MRRPVARLTAVELDARRAYWRATARAYRATLKADPERWGWYCRKEAARHRTRRANQQEAS